MFGSPCKRALHRLVGIATRPFTSSSAAAEAAGRFPTWLNSGHGRLTVPLTSPYLEAAHSPAVIPDEPPPTEVTTLSNGVRIVSEASTVRAVASMRQAAASLSMSSHPGCMSQGPTASLGIYVNSGSIYETPATSGAWYRPAVCTCSLCTLLHSDGPGCFSTMCSSCMGRPCHPVLTMQARCCAWHTLQQPLGGPRSPVSCGLQVPQPCWSAWPSNQHGIGTACASCRRYAPPLPPLPSSQQHLSQRRAVQMLVQPQAYEAVN
jgi:hypothetical protein